MDNKPEDNMEYTYIYLSIKADHLDFDYIDNALGLLRDHKSSIKKGCPGIYGMISKCDRWSSKKVFTTSEEIEPEIIDLLDRLLVKKHEVEEIQKRMNARVILEVVPNIVPEKYQPVMSVELETMKKLVSLNIDLDLDYYVYPEHTACDLSSETTEN